MSYGYYWGYFWRAASWQAFLGGIRMVKVKLGSFPSSGNSVRVNTLEVWNLAMLYV